MPLPNPTILKTGQSMHVEKGPAAAVRDRQVINLGQMTGLARFGETTAQAAVRLQDVYCLPFCDLVKPRKMHLLLPRGNRYFRMRAQVCERAGIVLVHRLLKPCNVALL